MGSPPDGTRRGRLLKRALALLLSACLLVLAVEVGARVFDPFGISYYKDNNRYFNEAIRLVGPEEIGEHGVFEESRLIENRPGVRLELQTFTFRTDASGLRAGEDAEPPPAGAMRALFLGDSVTLGWGVEDEDTWVRGLEALAEAPDGRPLVALNAGHLQYNTLQEADWFLANADALEPEVVVLTVVVNDLDDAFAIYRSKMSALEAAVAAPPPSAWERFRGSLPVRFRGWYGLSVFFRERQNARALGELAIERVEDAPGYAEGWARMAKGLERLKAACEERGLPLVVLDHTTPRIADLERWCMEADVPWFDFNFTPEEWHQDVRNSAADAHANALGNRLLCEKAFEALVGLDLVRPAAGARD